MTIVNHLLLEAPSKNRIIVKDKAYASSNWSVISYYHFVNFLQLYRLTLLRDNNFLVTTIGLFSFRYSTINVLKKNYFLLVWLFSVLNFSVFYN